jgi:hypothetical protein
VSKIHNSIIPQKELVTADCYRIHFARSTNESKKKYVYMHDVDKEYILHWCSRFVHDVVAGQVKDVDTLSACLEADDKMPRSQYTKERNSILSTAAGLVSNDYRNTSQDFGYKQLSHIKRLFNTIHYYYSMQDANNLGYNNNTRIANELPKKLMFKEA